MDSNSPLVSIVMPAYNAEAFVEKAIKSILDQSYTNFELLIADDLSKDNTRKLIDGFSDPRIKTFHNQQNAGYLKTCNMLFSKCTGELITFQDADDYSDTERIAIQVKVMNEDPTLGFCGTWYKRISGNGEITALVKKPVTYTEILEYLKKGNAFCGATIIFKKEILKTVGVYREFFDRIGNEDYDWAYMMAEKYKAVNIDKYLYYYRHNAESVSQEVSLKRFTSSEHAIHFSRQRAQYGMDDIQKGDQAAVDAYVKAVEKPYLDDPSHIYRKYANATLHGNDFNRSFHFIFKGIKKKPFKPVNYAVLYAILKKYILLRTGILKGPEK